MSDRSKKRPLSVSNGNRDKISRYDRCSGLNSSQTRSASGNSPPRVFIRPKSEGSNDKLARRTSSIPVASNLRHNSGTTVLRRTSSVYHGVIGPYNAPSSKLPRSFTVMRHTGAKSITSCEPGFPSRTSATRNDRTDAKKATRASSPKNKENELGPRVRVSPEKHAKSKRLCTRKSSIHVTEDIGPIQLPRRKTFLIPKVEEYIPRSEVRRPRRSTVHSVAPHLERRERMMKKKASLPSLPTMVITHSPGSAVSKPSERPELQQDRASTTSKECEGGYRQAHVVRVSKPSPRPFLLPRKPDALPSSTSLSSLVSLPTQILEHTPLAAQFCGSASGSPCLSKARIKTIWTMLDEMKLIRSGGLVTDADALAPDSTARVVPLCKRRRNGVCENESPRNVAALMRTPVRSSSTPYHLLVSSARRTCVAIPNDIPPLPSITRALAQAKAEWEADSPKGPKEKTTKDAEKNDWTLVNVKKPQRRSTVSAVPNSGPTPGGFGGYGICIRTHDATQRPKPSLLTRAQTLVKFKFSGSKKVVGRGDPNWA